MVLPIVHYNSPVLRQRGARVSVFDSKLAALAADMIDTMHDSEGIGLAAQQVGQPLQMCVVDLNATDKDFNWLLDGAKPPADIFMPFAMVNPKVTPSPGCPVEPYDEGCLSFPGIRGDVLRPVEIAVSYQDLFGITHELRCDGLLARCIQHEVDHLNGTLFIDRMAKPVRQKVEQAVKDLAKRTRDNAGE